MMKFFLFTTFKLISIDNEKRVILIQNFYNILKIKSNKMSNPIILNEQIQRPGQFQSFGNKNFQAQTYALDEPVMQTIKRDFKNVFDKISVTLSGEGDYQKLRKQWDMWGPLCITLFTASLCAFGTSGNSQEAFTNLFIGMWLGPLIITVNSNLLGAKIPILQSLCFIIYCSAPIAALALLVFVLNFIIGSFFVNLVVAICALLFTLRSNQAYFRSLVGGQKQLLNLYPVLLFYVFICLFIAMV